MPEQLESLYFIKRKAALSIKLLTLSLEPINGIVATPETDASLQDVKDHHLKIVTLYNQILDDVTNLMNIYISFSSQKTNDVMKILTIFSVFFIPITFKVGIYGMNFEYMPELSKRWGYPIVLIIMAVVTVIIYQWFKKKMAIKKRYSELSSYILPPELQPAHMIHTHNCKTFITALGNEKEATNHYYQNYKKP